MLSWTKRFNIFCFLDNCNYRTAPHLYECLLAAGVHNAVEGDDLDVLDRFLQTSQWTFGHLSYELKNSIHGFRPAHHDRLGFPSYYFFHPQVLLLLRDHELTIHAEAPGLVWEELMAVETLPSREMDISMQPRLTKEQYIGIIKKLQQHIQRGDCYEINFCQEFYAENVDADPAILYSALSQASPNPFAAFYRLQSRYLVCASPERFLFKEGQHILSQPMKGTIRRDLSDPAHDEALKQELRESAKDQSENVMVVDLVRNDLSRICTDGSVAVDELFGVYSYPRVHQMISTISGELRKDTSFGEVIRATFPMGSMTGAPKRRVMELIDAYETGARGIFSGAVGYIDPSGDFDFNVVIRSLMYNADTRYLSYQLGSGITFYSVPEMEWEECLLKGEAIKKVLTQKSAPKE